MRTWVVIYQTNTGFTYGWICKAHRIAEAEEEFWRSMDSAAGKSIMCIAKLHSGIVDAYFALYSQE